MSTFTNNWNNDVITMQRIQSEESSIPLTTCDNCGEEHKCKAYPHGHGNNILCQKCWNIEYKFQITDERGYTITDHDPNRHIMRNEHIWRMTEWYK